ncbi:chemotaxis protein CheB [Pseudonocardia sediminis]|uniref:chemotaxis protein CheB n=1 Tax=Pseudonocardia sediminis TaxID=1397368 RepID=UPI001028C586|nr:chemotaxis protein CheB [Pseudonocardia sediminis]
MTRRDTIVVGASAGGVEALSVLVSGLPADLPAAVLVVLHLPEAGRSALASVLDRFGPLPVQEALPSAPLRPGTVIVAPPGRHLLVAGGDTVLSSGPAENGHRPAVDALFRSAARTRGSAVIGVQLSGTLDDGAAGMVSIAAAGGTVVVQEPADAASAGMPEAVMGLLRPDHVLPASEIGPLLAALAGGDAAPAPAGPGTPDRIADALEHLGRDGGPFVPRQRESPGERYERALWTAHRVLRERSGLALRLEGVARDSDLDEMRRRHSGIAAEHADAAAVLRELLLCGVPQDRVTPWSPAGDGTPGDGTPEDGTAADRTAGDGAPER